MKTILKTFAILFISLVTISCSNDDDNSGTPTPTTDYFFKAKIDGVQYTADAIHVAAGKTEGRITIGSIVGNQNFNFTIDDYTPNGVGTYTIPDTEFYILNMEYGDGASATSVYAAGDCSATGTLTITSMSATEISGTFSFIGKKGSNCALPGKVISEGSFKSRI